MVERLRPRAGYELAFLLVTLCLAAPLVASRHVPLQDLPQHMAAISVLRRLLLGGEVSTYFVTSLSRTQYLVVYALGVPLSWIVGVEGAGKLLAAITVMATPYALRFVLRRAGGDERLAALSWPLLWNPQMMLGFLNFLLGIPLALLALGLYLDETKRHTLRRQVLLGALALTTFYAHVIPYGLMGLGLIVLLPWNDLRPDNVLGWLRGVWRSTRFLVPSVLAVLVVILRSPARDASVRAGGVGVVPHPEWPIFSALPRELSATILDFPGPLDERALVGWGLGLLAAFALASNPPARTVPRGRWTGIVRWALPAVATVLYLARHRMFEWIWAPAWVPESSWTEIVVHAASVFSVTLLATLALCPEEDTHTSDATPGARLAWLPLLCGALYLVTPSSYGWIWPIHTRFAVMASLIAPLLVIRRLGPSAPHLLAAALAVAGLGLSNDVGIRFARWESLELGDLDDALAHTAPNKRLVALLPATASAEVPNVPLLHAAAYYQMRGGAVATFSFADFPQSPFRYREGATRPPRLPPRWEWQTELEVADPGRDYYDYVLCRRGGPDRPALEPDRYVRVYDGRDWTLYLRRSETHR